ncbi:altered inheritance of mitochondria protein 6 [Aspergillus pseudoviridinutans]|uniref:Altered inheritance of mitochondria protein 6 n=1 Tax=Aspergillus pseudoviridinutans TaxID=1517512 RepID=A0A9P3BDE6_9EURO|nr:altered inheritance of mitochondria protein 6 [Aspergillus pseudoviridinutans]GIJ88925.1 altered inheritance of mitochondria protein 6 [Aspergillus pseudoviridinutans]
MDSLSTADDSEVGSSSSQETFTLLEMSPGDLAGRKILPLDVSDDLHSSYKRRQRCHWLSQVVNLWKCSHVQCNARPLSRRAIICRGVKRPFWALIWILGFLKVVSLVWTGLVHLFPDDLDSRLGAWVFPGGQPSIFSHWVTHGVTPVQCHSHNDYWRSIPLFSAIKAGCIGVEADIWLSGEDVLVGHNRFTLHHAATLRSLYLDPLLDLLEQHNTRSSRLQPDRSEDLAGVFAHDPSQTVVLLIDFKTDGNDTWPYLVEQLTPLREAGYLTHFDGAEMVQRPVTVVVSGDAPFHLIAANSTYRDIFFDAPLDKLDQPALESNTGEPASAAASDYNYTNSYYASVDFRKTIGSLSRNRFSQDQLARVREQVAAAHDRGLKVRYWGTPTWPRGLRNHVWHVLVREGVDYINVDDLAEGTMQDWRKHRSWWL